MGKPFCALRRAPAIAGAGVDERPVDLRNIAVARAFGRGSSLITKLFNFSENNRSARQHTPTIGRVSRADRRHPVNLVHALFFIEPRKLSPRLLWRLILI